MKALACGSCGDIQALQVWWRSCRCGNTSARWADPDRGTAVFSETRTDGTPVRKAACYGLGLNNHLLGPALRGELAMHQDFRAAHARATDAPGYVFDASRCGCWAVVFKVGATNDVSWVPAIDEVPA